MNSLAEVMPVEPVIARRTSSPRFFELCYLSAITVATIGWVSTFGWGAVRIASWLMS
jgi:hypothetical protein